MADAVATRLRRSGVAARTVTLKIRFHDFTTITRATRFADPVDSGPRWSQPAKVLLAGVDPLARGAPPRGQRQRARRPTPTRQLTLDDAAEAGAGRRSTWPMRRHPGSGSATVDRPGGACTGAMACGSSGGAISNGGRDGRGPKAMTAPSTRS